MPLEIRWTRERSLLTQNPVAQLCENMLAFFQTHVAKRLGAPLALDCGLPIPTKYTLVQNGVAGGRYSLRFDVQLRGLVPEEGNVHLRVVMDVEEVRYD